MIITHLKFFLKNCVFVLFVILCNLLFTDFHQAMTIGIRLGIIITATYIIFQFISPQKMARVIARLCAPLRIFHIDTDALALSITVALTFVPLLLHDARSIQSGLRLKGCILKTLCRHPYVYVTSFTNLLFCHIEAFEQALRLKGYE